jgi:hypothetical protein
VRFDVATSVVAMAIITLTASGCRQSPPQPPKALAVVTDSMATAREAMARRDYPAAITLLREVVARHPGDLEAHYRLGVSASQLDRLDDTRREFEWVVAHGDPGAPEVNIARDWLAAPASTSAVQPTAAVDTAAAEPTPEHATVSGRAMGPEGAQSRLQLVLKGVPGSTVNDEFHLLRTDGQGNFRFVNVVPGDYVLSNPVARPLTWRVKLSLSLGERRVLDLSPDNAVPVGPRS